MQVTDMMVANSSNLIITIRPANQRNPPFQYPKLPQQQSFNSTQTLNRPATNHQNHRTTSSNNHSSHKPQEAKHKTPTGPPAANNSTQRIPLNENTLASNKSSKFYLEAEKNGGEKAASMRTSLSANYLGANLAANLAEGEDSSDEEDEVKHHFQAQSNDFNKNGDGKTIGQESRSNH